MKSVKIINGPYSNKNGIILFKNSKNLCTIFIPSELNRNKKYVKIYNKDLKYIPNIETKYIHYKLPIDQYDKYIDLEILDNTIKLIKSVLNYEEISVILKYEESFSEEEREDFKNTLNLLYKNIINEIVYNKEIYPDLSINKNTVFSLIFQLSHIPLDLKSKLIKHCLNNNASGSDTIPILKDTVNNKPISLFLESVKIFYKTIYLKPILNTLLEYGINFTKNLYNFDKKYEDSVFKKDILNIILPDYLKNDCLICNDSILSYNLDCCYTSDSIPNICYTCHINLFNNYQNCPFCRQIIGRIIKPDAILNSNSAFLDL